VPGRGGSPVPPYPPPPPARNFSVLTRVAW
jgi:hypothetical protein